MNRKIMKTVFYTMMSDLYFSYGGGYLFMNSFKKFHPDIDLVVFRQDILDKYLASKVGPSHVIDSTGFRKTSFCTAKAFFGKMLYNKYDKVVNIDTDTIITGRLTEVLKDDWEVGGAWNFNDYENVNFMNIKPEMYVQAGLIGSTRKEFWDRWDEANKEATKYPRFENDTLNLVLYNDPIIKKMKLKIFDKKKDYYGCKSLGREKEMYIKNNELMLRGEKVKAYHHAKGETSLPKLIFERMGFTLEVANWLYKTGIYGKSVTVKNI
jgi:hypothetical protein